MPKEISPIDYLAQEQARLREAERKQPHADAIRANKAKQRAPQRERDIERHLVKRVKELGGEVRKVQWIGRRGAPDRLVMLPPWPADGANLDPIPRSTWVELKAPGIKPEAHQLREHDRMRAMGQRVVVIDSIEGVEELLR
jgi:hypothetical protein